MFYSVASPGWTPGRPMTPAGALLFRTRSEAESFAPGAPAVAVAVRFDARRQSVGPRGAAGPSTAGAWSAPAVGNGLGGVTVFGSIPAPLVRPAAGAGAGPAAVDAEGFNGWDSMTMALMA